MRGVGFVSCGGEEVRGSTFVELSMMEEEHEVYGGDIPEEVEGDLEGDLDGHPDDGNIKVDDVVTDDAASKVLSFCTSFLHFLLT